MTNQTTMLPTVLSLLMVVGVLFSGCSIEEGPDNDPHDVNGAGDIALLDTIDFDTTTDVAVVDVAVDIAEEDTADAAGPVDVFVDLAPDVPPLPPVFVCPQHVNCEEQYCDQVLIDGGEFNMGTTDEPDEDSEWVSGDARPIHLVNVDSFCIDKYEVSLERYENCMDAGICSPDGLQWEKADAPYDTTINHYPEYCYDDLSQCADRAVNGKTYAQAKAYCDWIGARICTEAEWERVANGPGLEKRLHPWGNTPPTPLVVNIPSTGTGYVEPVHHYAPGASVEGVFNLAGNVFEWTEDAYKLYPATPDGVAIDNPANLPLGQQHVIGRGSCFFTEPVHTVTDRTVFPQNFDWG